MDEDVVDEDEIVQQEEKIEEEIFGDDEIELMEDDVEDGVGDGVATEDEVIDRPSTKVQHNGRSYVVVIPLSIIEESELAKGDEIDWEVEELPDGKALKGYIKGSGAFKLPVNEREGGR